MAGRLQVPSKIGETQTKLTWKNETREWQMPLVESLEASFSQTHENELVSQPLLSSSSRRLATRNGPQRFRKTIAQTAYALQGRSRKIYALIKPFLSFLS